MIRARRISSTLAKNDNSECCYTFDNASEIIILAIKRTKTTKFKNVNGKPIIKLG